jgi:CzcA family heavy metal efflux pump
MLNRLIEWSLAHRGGVIGASALVLLLGIFTALRLPVEVLPDLTKPTVVILTEAPGLAPEEVETRVTQPIETALMGVAGLTRLRSNSDVSLSLVYAEFDWNSDTQKNRLLVQERLQVAREQLPEGIQPFMTPAASLMGEILLVGVRSTIPKGEPGHLTPSEVRSIADWTIKPRLQSIPGIAEVLNMGGGIRQVEIQPDPYRMQAYGVTLAELEGAAAHAANTSTGGFLSTGATEIMIRNLAMTTDLSAIGQTAIKRVGDRPVRIADVAQVVWGIEPMRGDATISQAPEKTPTYGVIMSLTKAPGFDTRALTGKVKAALAELEPSLPRGVENIVLFQQKDFIDNAIGNLKKAIVEAAIMVTLVLVLFLLNFRTTFITLTAIPMSFGMTLLTFHWFGISVNSMTLGGLAVAIGMVVDDAIVDVENVFRRLRENAARPDPAPRIQVIARASREVRSSIFYATLLIVLVFVPLLGLTGVEGKLFTPIAVATIVSMLASFLVSLTLIPVLCSFLLDPKPAVAHQDAWIVRIMKQGLQATALRIGFEHPWPVLAGLGMAVLAAFSLYPKMGKDFLPSFKEETALIAATSAPGTSLDEMNRISDVIEEQILSVPEVQKVGRRLGRAERGDHVVPVSTAEFDVDFRAPGSGEKARSRQEILDDIRARVKSVPGVFAVVGGPLADRIGHMMSGVSAPVAIKVFGPDLDTLRDIGTQIQTIAKKIPGFEDAKLDQQSVIPQLRIEPDRERCAGYGIAPGDLNNRLSTLIGGKEIAELREEQRTINLVLRLPLDWRDSPERIAELPIQADSVRYFPLSAVADVREAKGPNVIFRENGQRRFTIAIKPSVRDVGALVNHLQREVSAKVQLPEGYFVTYEGEFQAQRDATWRIAILSLVVFFVVVFLLYGYFQSLSLTLQVLLNIPLALLGGLVLTWLLIDNISIATLVGFIAVGGIAARNGIMMLSHYLHLMRHEGEGFTRQMVERGTLERMVPVLMTALSAGIALIPFVLAANEPGKEILHPVAVVIVGGLISSTLLDFLITPLIFYKFAKSAALRAITRQAAASQ